MSGVLLPVPRVCFSGRRNPDGHRHRQVGPTYSSEGKRTFPLIGLNTHKMKTKVLKIGTFEL